MKHISFESLHRDESNGLKIIEIQSLDVEIIRADYKDSHCGNFVNINATDMKHLPFESSHWDESNGLKIIEIQSLDAEIIYSEFLYYFILLKLHNMM